MDVSRRGFLRLALATAAVAAVAPSSLIGTSEYVSERDKVQISGIPNGWLVCDGSDFSSEKYPELSGILKDEALPDFSARFIRTPSKSHSTEIVRSVYLIKHSTEGTTPAGTIVAALAKSVV